jgi:uncharacterized protein YwqG
MKRDRENLRKLITELGFGDLQDYLLQFARPSIRVITSPVNDEADIPIGHSKIGGTPDLPQGIDWVKVDYGDRKRSMPFIAQFNLTELKPYDEENLLPGDGMLYFFADLFNGLRFKDRGRVVFFDGDLTTLERVPFPDDIPPNVPMEWGERYDPCAVEFVPEINLPFDDDVWAGIETYPEGKTWENFYDVLYAASYAHHPQLRTVNRLLGYNYGVPHDMQLDCALIAAGESPYTRSKELREQHTKTKGEWQLLFQMDSDTNAGMMWSDTGVICFYIRLDDLKNRNIDNVCLAFFTP